MTNDRFINQSLKITIVAHGLRAGGGISVGKNLIASLLTVLDGTSFQIFVPDLPHYKDIEKTAQEHQWHFYDSEFGLVERWLYDQFSLVKLIKQFSPDVILSLGNVGVKIRTIPQILLIQDAHYFYPEKYYSNESFLQRIIIKRKSERFRNDLKAISALLCQTKTAEKRIKETYSFTKPIILIPNAISNSIEHHSQESRASTKKATFDFFYLTRYYTHKNLEILLPLFEKYKEELRNVRVYLTISVDQHPKARKLLQAIDKLKLGNYIINIGPIDQNLIASHFKKMDALLMPTTLESYSGTYIEAMNFELPILTSDIDFAREICGDAALYFDPWSIDSIYSQIKKLTETPSLGRELAHRGKQQLLQNKTIWIENAATVANIIEHLTQEKAHA